MKINDFFKLDGKKILLANNISIGNSLRRIYNIRNETITTNIISTNVKSLVNDFYISYSSFYNDKIKTIIDGEMAYLLLRNILVKNQYFKLKNKSIERSTVNEILKCINEIRLNYMTVDWNNAEDKELKKLIIDYERLLKDINCLDYPQLLNDCLLKLDDKNVDIIQILPWTTNIVVGDLETNIWNDKENSFIDLLLKKLNIDKKIIEYTNDKEIKNNKNVKYNFYKSYGKINEIKHCILSIKNYNNSAIYYSSKSYLNYIRGELENANIPYFVDDSVSAKELDTVQFFLSVLDTARDDFLYTNFKKIIENPMMTFENQLNQYINKQKVKKGSNTEGDDELLMSNLFAYNFGINGKFRIGWGYKRYIEFCNNLENDLSQLKTKKISANEKKKVVYKEIYIEFIKDFIKIFYNIENEKHETQNDIKEILEKMISFFRKYSYRKNEEWTLIKNNLDEEIERLELLGLFGRNFNDKLDILIDFFENLKVTRDIDKTGLLVAPIYRLNVLEREDNFIIGLSAKDYAKNTYQSPLMLDYEKKKYFSGMDNDDKRKKSNIDFSDTRNEKLNKTVLSSLNTLDNGSITMSYCYYDTVALRENAPAIFFLNLLGNGKVNEDQNANYGIINSNIKVDADKHLKQLKNVKLNRNKYLKIDPKNYNFSATSIQELLQCPLQYEYKYRQNLKEYVSTEKISYQWLDNLSKGNIHHRVMEAYLNEIVDKNHNLPKEFNEKKFNQCFETEINNMVNEVAFPAEIIYKLEVEYYKNIISSYAKYLHMSWNNKWKLIGCEISFSDMKYKGGYSKKNTNSVKNNTTPFCFSDEKLDCKNFDISLNGSIDRLDGYVENRILNLRVVDYKTGKIKNKEKEVENHIQIQHFVYANAALKYVFKNKNKLEKYLGKFNKVQFYQIGYDFVYEMYKKGSKSNEAIFLDVTDEINKSLKLINNNHKLIFNKYEQIPFPPEVEKILSMTVGIYENGDEKVLSKNYNDIIKDIIVRRCINLEKIEKRIKENIKLEERDIKLSVPVKSNIFVDIEINNIDDKKNYVSGKLFFPVSDLLEKFCNDNFCPYKTICRKYVGYQDEKEIKDFKLKKENNKNNAKKTINVNKKNSLKN